MNETINKLINDINPNEWVKVLNLFDELSDLSVGEQTQELNGTMLSESAKTMLIKMLGIQHQENMLDQTINPLVEMLLGAEAIEDHVNPSDIIGRTFGVWQAIESLGTGGMGQVFVAERADGNFEKKVALKVIKSGQFSTLSQQRFLTEMQTLAQFEHPNIAHLIDGGTNEDGITYFVMELVSGEPIVEYANKNDLTLSERIELVLQVIDAVEYAHQSLIIHGDIKPANILVNQSGQVKLVDFGIARPLEEARPNSYLPQFTPGYSSPEQAQGQVLTTASDVFGLCAVLYELCTGSSPRDCEPTITHDMYSESLTKPITAAFTNFQSKKTRSHVFRQALAQELGAIIDKGLQIEVVNRYKNTTELRRDLLLFQSGSAVPSFSTNRLYRYRKLFSQYKWPVLLSSLGLLSIIVVALVAINQARLAEQEAAKANWANQFLLSIFNAADPTKNQQNPIPVNQLTAEAAARIMNDDGELMLKTTSLDMLSQVQYKLGEVDSAEKLVKEQIRLMKKLPVDAVTLAAVHIKAGDILESKDSLEEAISHYQEALQLTPLKTNFTEPSLRATLALANGLLRTNEIQQSDRLIQILISEKERIQKMHAADSLMANLYTVKADLLLHKKEFTAAIEQAQLAKEWAENVIDEPLLYPQILGIESDVYYEKGDLTQAAKLDRELVDYFSQKFGENHPETIDHLGRLAVSLAAMGELQSAITINQRIITNFNGSEIKGHQIPAAHLNMGTAYQALSDDIKAIEHFIHAQSMWSLLEPRIPLYEVATAARMAESYLNLKQYDEAQNYFNEAFAKVANEFGQDHALYARFQVMYSRLLLEENRIEEASSIIPKAYQRLVEVYGIDSKNAAVANIRWAQLNLALGQQDKAIEQAANALKILDVDAYRKRSQYSIGIAKNILKTKL